MHERHPWAASALCIILSSTEGLVLDDPVRGGAMSSTWSIGMAHAVAVGHHDGVTRAFTLEQMHQRKGLRVDGF